MILLQNNGKALRINSLVFFFLLLKTMLPHNFDNRKQVGRLPVKKPFLTK